MGFLITSLDALGGHPVILCPPKCRLVFVVVVVIGGLAVLKILVGRLGYMTMWFQSEYVIFLIWFSMYRYVILLAVDGGGSSGGLWKWWLFWLSFIFYFYFYFGMGIDCGGNDLYSLWLWWLVLIVGEERKRQRGREKSQWMKRETVR